MKRCILPVIVLVTLMLLAACGQATTAGNNGFGEAANQPQVHTTAGAHAPAPTPQAGTLQPVLATSQLVVGPNRMAFGILENNVPIADAATTKVHVRYFKIEGEQATVVGEEDARFYGENLGQRGTFVVYPTFDTAGTWGLEVQAQRPNKAVETQRIGLQIAEKGSAPNIGEPAPATKTPKASEVAELTTITSDANPQPRFYQMSVADAVTSGKPSLIMFATPGFCETAVCGPSIEVLARLSEKFGDKLNTVHVEVYQLPYEGKPVAAMQEWGLQSEPWLFLVDKDGRIAGRYEGGITFDELEPAVTKLVG